MCSTCGCGKKADTFEAPKRQRIGNRFISRRKDGTISKNVNVGRSLSADRRRKAKTTASAGQGDKGDLKRAESKFDKLSNEIAKDYEKKGKSKDEAEEIGKATAYKIGVAKYGKRGMERKARAGRAKNAESFGAEVNRISHSCTTYTCRTEIGGTHEGSDAMRFLAFLNEIKDGVGITNIQYEDSMANGDPFGNVYFKFDICGYGKANITHLKRLLKGLRQQLINKGADYEDLHRPIQTLAEGDETNEEWYLEKENFGAEEVINEYDIDMYSLMTFMAFQDPTELSVVKQAIDEMGCDRDTVRWAIYWWNSNWGGVPEETLNYLGLSESFGADEKKRSGMKIAPKIQMVNYEDVMTEKMKNQNMKDAESFGSESGGAGHLVCTECRTSHDIRDTDGWLIYGVGTGMKEILCPECGKESHPDYYDNNYGEGAGYLVCTIEGCYNSSDINTDRWYIGSLGQNAKVYCPTHGRGEYPEYYDDDYNAEEFGADGYFPDDSYYGIDGMTYVKRPHHVAYVRKAHAERPMDKGFEYPNMHTDQNKQGKIWDDRTGFRKMDSKERRLFEEIGGKISDFNVVETTQDVVGKTGFNIPTGVASIAVVFMAYMTGKKYGN